MKKELIDHLLWLASPMDNDITKAVRSELPANAYTKFLECQIVFTGGYSVTGVLTSSAGSGFPHETLRLLTPGKRGDNSLILADHYFTADEVVTIVVARDLPRTPTILRAS